MGIREIGFVILSFLIASCGAAVPRFTNEGQSGAGRDIPTATQAPSSEELKRYENVVPLDIFTGTASYYAEQYNGRRTSNGEVYDMNSLTAAHQDLPFNSIVRVTNLENQKAVILRINDRGWLKKGRIIDVSLEAAKRLSMIGSGTAKVRVEVLKYGESLK